MSEEQPTKERSPEKDEVYKHYGRLTLCKPDGVVLLVCRYASYTFSAMLLQPVVIAVFVELWQRNMQTAMIIGAGIRSFIGH